MTPRTPWPGTAAALSVALVLAGCAGAPPDPALCPVPTAQELYPGDSPPNPFGELLAADACVAAPHDVIIVLGCPSGTDGSPSTCQQVRAALAAALYERGLGARVITTGAAVQNRFVEAEALRELLARRGVPREAILTEPRAEHTDENIYYSTLLMEREGWNDALVVSDNPGHLLATALCDSNCCVKKGRLTVLTLPLSLEAGAAAEPWAVGHYVRYPLAAAVEDAECAYLSEPRRYLCLNLPSRRACAGRLRLPSSSATGPGDAS